MNATEQARLVESLTEQIWRRIGAKEHSCSCQRPACSPCDISDLVVSGACRVSVVPPTPSVDPATASLIDHTLLKADATRQEIVKICDEAMQYGFASV